MGCKYKLTQQTAWKKKNGIFAVYCNYKMTFLKGIAANYFSQIIADKIEGIPKDFILYLVDKGIVYEV